MNATHEHESDYIVVGGGTAGCILAARLSEDPRTKVTLIEAGPRDSSPKVHVPIGFSRLLNDRALNWCLKTEPQDQLHGRRIDWPRGKVLGGSSSINGMIWVRGDDRDFDDWASIIEDDRWSWKNVQRHFEKLEAGDDAMDDRIGRSGKIGLESTEVRNGAVDAFLSAAKENGLPHLTDLGISDRVGAGPYLLTRRNGRRVSSAGAYLKEARTRENLRILTRATVSQVLFDDGNVATGVRARHRGASIDLKCRRGVILAAGAIGSPHLLMLSGIGPAAQLRKHGIPVRLDASEVGQNLRDHYGVRVVTRIKPQITINSDFRRPWRLARYVLQYALHRTGPLSVGGAYAGAFFSPEAAVRPSMQALFLPLSMKGPGWNFHPFSAVTCNVYQLRPKSVGALTLASPDPSAAPLLDPNYLSAPEDRAALVSGVRSVRDLLSSPAFVGAMESREFLPGPDVRTDDEILDFARSMGSTVFHPVGTCRMGADPGAVVSPEGQVRGTRNLWVGDASIMPTIPSGNTNAASAMIAEQLSEFVRGIRVNR